MAENVHGRARESLLCKPRALLAMYASSMDMTDQQSVHQRDLLQLGMSVQCPNDDPMSRALNEHAWIDRVLGKQPGL